MSSSSHIIDPDTLRELSGKKSAAAVQRWAERQGIRTFEGAGGRWTTLDAVNKPLGVVQANEQPYSGDDIA